ncbi:Beta-galactosidase C-terminal domain [Paenibacillus larvae]
MIQIRQQEQAFSPYAEQEIVDFVEKVFALKRVNKQTNDTVYFAVNVDINAVTVNLDIHGTNLLTNKKVENTVTLAPYEFIWAKI